MQLLRRIRNQCLVPGFLVNSHPKSGTHLLAKLMSLFPGVRWAKAPHESINFFADFREPAAPLGPTVPVGVNAPWPLPLAAARRALRHIPRAHFATVHVPYSDALAGLLAEQGMKALLILRDPRDVVVSQAHYIPQKPLNPNYPLYAPLSHHDRIMLSIRGREATGPDNRGMFNIETSFRAILGWNRSALNYTTFFEKLIGPRGGGSTADQVAELRQLARHMGIKYSPRDLKRVISHAFGKSATFRKGMIGDWREQFTPEHKQAFKEVAGQLLIELGYERDLAW
jgi:hypothetical protein